jgi:hypothetical protein
VATVNQIGHDVTFVDQLIGEGYRIIQARRAAIAESEASEERQRQEKIAEYNSRVRVHLTAIFPAELLPYINVGDRDSWRCKCTLQIPNADPVRFELTKDGALNGTLEIPGVPYVDTAYDYDRPAREYVCRDRHAEKTEFPPEGLPVALYLAQERYHQAQIMELECEAHNAATRAAWETERNSDKIRREEQATLTTSLTGERLALYHLDRNDYLAAAAVALYELAFNKQSGH